jgi:hypothetical protein
MTPEEWAKDIVEHWDAGDGALRGEFETQLIAMFKHATSAAYEDAARIAEKADVGMGVLLPDYLAGRIRARIEGK